MDKFDKRTYEIIKRLQNARLSLLSKQPFYALLLIHMKFSLDITCETAYTDGNRIAFNPDFMDKLSDKELEFVLMHEVLHAALGHPFRRQSDYNLECYDIACDIVVNSNILYSFNMDIGSITLKSFGVSMHKTPSGKEGYKFTVEEVYNELLHATGKKQKNNSGLPGGSGGGNSSNGNDSGSDGDSSGDENLDSNENSENEAESDNKNKGNGKGKGKGQESGNNLDGTNDASDSSGKPSRGSGSGEITEDDLNALIADLLKGRAVHGKVDPNSSILDDNNEDSDKQGILDDHSFWNGDEEDNIGRDTWLNRMIDATDIIVQGSGIKNRGKTPLAAERIINELKNPTLDWRTILNDFVQEEICDYSFSPPDKRMEESPFFLPDFNEKDESVKDILFMIDTSGSMSESQITECYSEIYGAIGQFDGKLQGKLGFFDAVVVEPIPFEDEEEFKIIRPKGGGGTSFDIIFEYVEKEMEEEPPVSIVILTDGYAPFPDESKANGIPVLWIINNNDVNPPWGKVARILENAPE
jgi:predicted metal-dependent peptidase